MKDQYLRCRYQSDQVKIVPPEQITRDRVTSASTNRSFRHSLRALQWSVCQELREAGFSIVRLHELADARLEGMELLAKHVDLIDNLAEI